MDRKKHHDECFEEERRQRAIELARIAEDQDPWDDVCFTSAYVDTTQTESPFNAAPSSSCGTPVEAQQPPRPSGAARPPRPSGRCGTPIGATQRPSGSGGNDEKDMADQAVGMEKGGNSQPRDPAAAVKPREG